MSVCLCVAAAVCDGQMDQWDTAEPVGGLHRHL